MAADEYPEHAKLLAVVDESQAIGEFIDNGGYILAKVDGFGHLYTDGKSITDVLAEYFGIEQSKLEQEKRAMLARIREVG